MNEVRKWFKDTNNNVGIVTGKASDNLTVFDFDDEELFKEFYKRLDDRLKDIIRNTWVAKTQRGFQVYLRVDTDRPIRSMRFKGVDIKAEGGYVVAPPSVHPSGIRYEFLNPDMPLTYVIRKVTEPEFLELVSIVAEVSKNHSKDGFNPQAEAETNTTNSGLKVDTAVSAERNGSELKTEPVTQTSPDAIVQKEWKNLTNNQIMKIVELIKPYYRPGLRHNIVLYLAGWLYKAGVSYESAQTLVKSLCEATNDEECNDRLYTVKDTYGVERPVREEVLKQEGKGLATAGGLFTWLTDVGGFDEDSVLGLIKDLEDVLERPNPHMDVIVELLSYRKGQFAVVNFRNCEVYTAVLVEDKRGRRLERDDKVVLGCPESLTVIIPPYSDIPKYDITWNVPTQKRKIKLEGHTLEEVLAKLDAHGLVLHRNAKHVLSAVIDAMVRKGIAEVKTEYEAPGYYWVNGGLVAVKVNVEKPTHEELKEAMELLNELGAKWFADILPQFLTALKVGVLMPFSFAIKQKFSAQRSVLPWLYLYGPPDTGKTTVGKILLAIAGVNPDSEAYDMSHTAVDTEAKMGYVLARDTFPKLVNESHTLFSYPNIVEMVKHSVEGFMARQRFESKTIIREFPALSPMIFTANYMWIKDPALIPKRIIAIRFPISARKAPEKIAEFKEKVSGRLRKLKALGQFIASYLIEHPEELTYDWVNLSTKLLKLAYEYTGVKPAFDLNTLYVETDEYDPRLDIVLVLWVRILDAFKKLNLRDDKGNPLVFSEPKDVLDKVLYYHAVDFMVQYGSEVLFTSKVLDILHEEKIDIDSMHALADVFADYGFRYEIKKVQGKTTRVLSVSYRDLVRLFAESFFPQDSKGKPLTEFLR
jgi:hypothetical protein